MISKEKIAACASTIVDSVNLKPEECVYVTGGQYSRSLLEEIGIGIYKKGAFPLIEAPSDGYLTRLHDEIPVKTLEKTPRHILSMVKDIDAYITIESPEDPSIRLKFPREKIAARQEANQPIREILYGEKTGRGKKWLYAGWPSLQAAKYYGIDYEKLERFIVDGMLVPQRTLMERCQQVASLLKGAESLHVTDSDGTDFTVKIRDRRINLDDGFTSDLDIEENDLGGNLPAGEVFIACHEEVGEGILFSPLTKDRLSGAILKNVTLRFKDGKLLLDQVEADENLDYLVDSFKRSLETDKKNVEDVRALNVGELGIGLNPAITEAIGYILTDEKIGGTIHLAFGSNFSYGGTSKSTMHWDFVTGKKATAEVKYDDGSMKTFLKNGKTPYNFD
jgi:aminopeptidase